jgi:hypothetical protein
MSIQDITPVLPVNHDAALSMVRNPSPISNYTNFTNPISGPAAVIRLSPEATTMLGK